MANRRFERQTAQQAVAPSMRLASPVRAVAAHPTWQPAAVQLSLGVRNSVRPQTLAAQVAQASGGKLARAGQTLLGLQQRWGNQYVQQVVQAARQASPAPATPAPLLVQPKLAVTPPDYQFEAEADRVAGQVMRQLNSRATPHLSTSQRADDTAAADQRPGVQVMRQMSSGAGNAAGMAIGAGIETAIQAARSGGQPLPDATRTAMEGAFGADFGAVRVHTGVQADALNQSLNARAFTTGQDIFFRRGEYRSESVDGQQLLAHELTHVVQQGGGVRTTSSPPLIQRTTGTEVEDWRTAKLEPTVTELSDALDTFEVAAMSDINDNDTLKQKLNAIARELAGHTTEIVYGSHQYSQGRGSIFFGKYTAGGHTFGADITAARDAGKATSSKAIQIKTISTASVDAVYGAVVKATKQLAGATKSREAPRMQDQRIMHIVIKNDQNPFPLTNNHSVADIATLTKDEVAKQLHTQLGNWSLYNAFDKVKLVYTSPRIASDGQITSITLDRPGGGRSPQDDQFTDLRNIVPVTRVQ